MTIIQRFYFKVMAVIFISGLSLCAYSGQDTGNDSSILEPLPRLTFIQATVDDSSGGNNNGIMEPGETAKVAVRVLNFGTATAWNVYGQLNTNEVNVTVNVDVAGFGTILPKNIIQTQVPHFEISVGSSVPCGSNLVFSLVLSGSNYQGTVTFNLPMRKIPISEMVKFNEDSVVYGADEFDYAGIDVASGDVNGDGYDDLIFGSYAAYMGRVTPVQTLVRRG